ncbi:beta-1,3-galactosyltransferase 1 [Drosophila novamexicana]|uniref:beta-1,3-galactosyltransferase 1 n=1 Tax=Drosophila novamexicana TaxID=47314 RepID=UPI0011E5FC44|nr:beta-1,3-galactosyltransferase 1 [Drosophila novamexicana]XP_030560651.1 beta-1,3-galactosyltransferase 1 [Drosophila novamexicana]
MGYVTREAVELEQQCTLLEEPTGGTPASGSDDESQPKHKMRAKRNIYRRQSMCYYLPRCLKRFGCSMRYQLLRCFKRFGYFMLCSFFILMLYTIVQYFCIDVQKRHVSLSDWAANASLDLKDYIQAQQETALIMPRDFCRNKTFLIIAVCTGLNNFVARQTIRETWGNTTEFNYAAFGKLHGHMKGHYLPAMDSRLQLYADYLSGEGETLTAKVRIVFIVGRSNYESQLGNETLIRLHNEAEMYNDIIQENFIDSYNNLTLKSVSALKHISKRCSKTCAFFLKCDDDTFVNVPNLLHFLLGGTVPLYNDTLDYHDRGSMLVMSPQNRLNATSGIMRGHQFCNVVPVSDVTSKWYMPYYMYKDEAYPKYLSGAGYLMSIDVVERLFEASLNTTLVYLEDIFITGLCANRANVKRQHHALFSFAHSPHLCAFKGSITQHQVREESMADAWRFVSNYSIQCPPPGRYLNHMRLRNRNNC